MKHPACLCPLMKPRWAIFCRRRHYSLRVPFLYIHCVKLGGFWDVGFNFNGHYYSWDIPRRPRRNYGSFVVTLALLCLTNPAFAQADGTQADGSGSPAWFAWSDFCQGSAAAWVIVGPMFLYWLAKRQTSNAMR